MKIINQDVQRENNIALILHFLRQRGDWTRSKLADETGLAQATVTKIINLLMEWDIVCERESIGSGVGRKAIRLHLNAEHYRTAALRINRDYLIAAIYDMDGRLYGMTRKAIRQTDGAEYSANRLVRMLAELLESTGQSIMAIGVSVPGPYNYKTQRITLMSGFPGWNKIDLNTLLTEAFHLPVFIEQDANCGAMAEIWYSDTDPDANLVFIAADRGIGAGLIMNSRIYRGRDGYAGEFGHSSINIFGPRCECGNRGCLELYGSTTALENTYKNDLFNPLNPAAIDPDITRDDILQLVREGDPTACRAYSKTVAYLCFGVVSMINMCNPDVVVFDDKITHGGELFLQVAKQTLQQYLMPEIYNNVQVRVSSIEGDPMLLGASVVAFNNMLKTPSAYFNRYA